MTYLLFTYFLLYKNIIKSYKERCYIIMAIKTISHYEVRINKLKHNGKDNGNIIRKLERQKRAAVKQATSV